MDMSHDDVCGLLDLILGDLEQERDCAGDDMADEARVDPEGANFYGGIVQGVERAIETIKKWRAVVE